MGTYAYEEQRAMDAVDLTEGKKGFCYMVSISLEELKAMKHNKEEDRYWREYTGTYQGYRGETR